MSDLEIIAQFQSAIASGIINPFPTYYDCPNSNCDTCLLRFSCVGLTGNGKFDAEPQYAKRIYPFLSLPEYSLSYLQEHRPELFV